MTRNKREVLIKLLESAKAVFERKGILFWLDCGTLLGAIRDKDIINWDHDIDLGCWKNQNDYSLKIELKKEFQALGYNVFITDHWLNIHFNEFPEINLDVNFYIIDGEYAITPSSSLYPYLTNLTSTFIDQIIRYFYNKKIDKKRFRLIMTTFCYFIYPVFFLMNDLMKKKILDFLIFLRKKISGHRVEAVPRIFFENFKIISVFSGDYNVPLQTENYLKYRYGENWIVPKKDWDTFKQDGTII